MAMVDVVVDPRDVDPRYTRGLLARALKRTTDKKVERPFRRREIFRFDSSPTKTIQFKQ